MCKNIFTSPRMPNPIVIYSNKCKFSKNFISKIQSEFEYINIDKINGKRPDNFFYIQKKLNYIIRHVPTIVHKNGEQIFILSGEDAFLWLEDYEKSLKDQSVKPSEPVKVKEPSAILSNPVDEYMNLNPVNKTLDFRELFTVNNVPPIQFSNDKDNEKRYQELMSQRDSLLEPSKPPKNIDFSTGKVDY